MGYIEKQSHAGANDGVAGTTPRAPGKRTRTQDLPPKEEKPEIVMTGYPLLDEGLACDGQEGQTPDCFLDERAAQRLFDMIQTRTLAVCLNYMAALGNVRLELLIGKGNNWNGGKEILFMLITNAAIGPLAGTMASVAAWSAVDLAVRGHVRSAWALASVDAAAIAGGLTLASKGLRTQLVHSGGPAPANQVEYNTYLQSLVSPTADNILQSIAQQQLNHPEMLELLARLNDQEIVGIPQIMARIRTLIDQFEDNKIGSIGNVMDLAGGYEVAAPVRVKVRKTEYMVLCQSYGVHNSVFGLNGANMDRDRTPMTMESLTFLKIVEPAFHGLMAAEYKDKRKQDVPFIDFNKPGEREKNRWFDSLYVELMHNTKARDLAYPASSEEE